MIVDNGSRVPLVIDGVFDGDAGLSRGVLAFIPNRTGRAPEQVRGGVMNGHGVKLTVERDGEGPMYLARFGPLA